VATCVSGCIVCIECRAGSAFVGENNFNIIKMHGTTIKIKKKTLDIIPIRGIKKRKIKPRKSIEFFFHKHCTKIQNLGPKHLLETEKRTYKVSSIDCIVSE
jgi:hypothetical protein